MKAVYKLFSFLGILLYLIGPAFLPAVALAQTSASIVATPSSGAAPLSVTFSGNGGAGEYFGGERIDFGDDSTLGTACSPGAACNAFQSSHTYTVAGTYAVRLIGIGEGPSTGGTLANTTVRVSAGSTGGAPTCTMSVSPSHINVGGSVTLRWSSTNATAGAITNVGNVGPSGSVNLLPSSAAFTTYIGSFTGPRGTANCSATVSVGGNGGGTSGVGDGTAGNTTDYGTQDATLGNSTATPAPTAATPASTVPTNSATSALVPCGTGGFNANDTSNNNSTACQACDLATLIQNIINFLIGISIPIAAALFAWAGVLYFTSAGDHHKLDQAKGIFRNAFIGFLIIISAWLVINTLLHVLFSQGEFANGNWFTIQCSAQTSRPMTESIGSVLGNVLGFGQVTNNVISTSQTPPPGGACDASLGGCFNADGSAVSPYTSPSNAYSCANGYNLSSTNGLVSCDKLDSSGDVVDSQDATCVNGGSTNDSGQCADKYGNFVYPSTGTTAGGRGVAQCTDENPICSIGSLTSQGLTQEQANAMSCIAITENAGQPVGCSGTGPCGAYQISQTNWKQYAPANCSAAAFGGSITAAQNNGACNQQTMVAMLQSNPVNPYQPWTGNNNGVYWNTAARTCVNNYDPNYLK